MSRIYTVLRMLVDVGTSQYSAGIPKSIATRFETAAITLSC